MVNFEETEGEVLLLLFTEFEERPFTPEQASLFCGVSLEMLEELRDMGYLQVIEGEFRIPPDLIPAD